MADTIRRVPRPRGVLTDETIKDLAFFREERDKAERKYRERVVLALFRGGSFNEVSKATGLSKDTLQRWKREAGK